MIKNYDTSTQITPHFNSSEFKCKCGCKGTKIDDRLVIMLEQLFDKVHAKQINVVSGYRCPAYDKKIGGFAGFHSKGMAADIQVIGKDNKPISTKIMSCVAQDMFKDGGIANINKTYTNIHIDSRTGSRWLGNEVVSNSTVTKDFYKYYNLTKEEVERACGGVIKGICQIPDGESYLLGLEVNENNNYTYEIQIYSNNLKAWVDGSGKINNGEKSLWWNYTPHENGVYMSLFRVYQNNDIVEEKTYLFERG